VLRIARRDIRKERSDRFRSETREKEEGKDLPKPSEEKQVAPSREIRKEGKKAPQSDRTFSEKEGISGKKREPFCITKGVPGFLPFGRLVRTAGKKGKEGNFFCGKEFSLYAHERKKKDISLKSDKGRILFFPCLAGERGFGNFNRGRGEESVLTIKKLRNHNVLPDQKRTPA